MTKRTNVRAPARAGQFYAADAAQLRRHVRQCVGNFRPPDDLGDLVGGVVPHAGWVYSGPTAAKVFVALSARAKPDTYVLLGAVHYWQGDRAAAYPDGAWLTPLGEIAVDAELVSQIVAAGRGAIIASAPAHNMEHSIEVQVPFIQSLSPDARIAPVAVPPTAEVIRVGESIASAILAAKRKAVVVASTDLTHYGMGYGLPDRGPLSVAMAWMRENDRRFLRLVESLRAEEIVAEAEENYNACGAGAVAAAVAAARKLKASSGRLLEYTTSADVMGETDADRAVGYAAVVFEKGRGV